MSGVRRVGDLPEQLDLSYSAPAPTDDDYSRFLSSLFGEEVLPDDDKDDPDFLEDLKRMMEEYSDDEFLNTFQFGGTNCVDPGPLPPSIWPPLESQPPPLERRGNDGYSCLSPARCTRSRYPMNGLELEDIEGQLYQQMDWNLDDRDFLTQDEFFDQQVVDNWPTDVEEITRGNFHLQNPETGPMIHLPANFNKPVMEFEDLFPYGLLTDQTESYFLPSSMNNVDIDVPIEILKVNTLAGPRLVAANAWTPQTILALNKIINAHIQLLVQSYSACVGVPYMKRTCDAMHGLLHQSYLLFQTQATGDFHFDRMLTVEVNRILSCKNEETRNQSPVMRTSKRSRKRRREQLMLPEEIIDLTDDANEAASPDKNHIEFTPLKTVLDVPLMHLLPHLWHALTVVTVKTNGAILTHYDQQRIEAMGQTSREKGLVASLSGPRRIQKILKCLKSFMTCGTRLESEWAVRRSRSWSKMELFLLSYGLKLYGTNSAIIRQHLLPSKDPLSMEKGKEKIQSIEYDMEWKKVERILKETDLCCTTLSGMEKKVISAQDKLFAFGTEHQSLRQNGLISDTRQIPQYVLSSMEQLHGQIANSASSLMDQANSIVEVPKQMQRSTVNMRDEVCLVLEQLGKQISASVDTILAMFNLIGSVNSAKPQRTTTDYRR
eukprot:g1478.t1